MRFTAAMMLLSGFSAACVWGEADLPFSVAVPLAVMPLVAAAQKQNASLKLFLPFVVASFALRTVAAAEFAGSSQSAFGTLVLMALCVTVAVVVAVSGHGAIYSAPPVFFVSAATAVCALLASPVSDFAYTPIACTGDILTPVLLPLSGAVCCAYLCRGGVSKAFEGCILGAAVCALLLLFSSAMQVSFITVPLYVFSSAVELKFIGEVIYGSVRE